MSPADQYLYDGLVRIMERQAIEHDTTEMFDDQLGGLFGSIKDAIKDVGHTIGNIAGDVVGVAGSLLPYVGAAVGTFFGNPAAGYAAGQAILQIGSRDNANDAAHASQEMQERAQRLAAYLQSAGIDISGEDAEANVLIQALAARGYDFKSEESQALIRRYVEMKKAESSNTWIWIAGGAAVLGVVTVIALRK